MTRRTALLRHPLSIAGVLVTTVSAVIFIALVIALLSGTVQQPGKGPVHWMDSPKQEHGAAEIDKELRSFYADQAVDPDALRAPFATCSWCIAAMSFRR